MDKKELRLVLCDMDGTLLANDKTISEENRNAIELLKERKILFSICTGRIQPMTEYYLKDLALTTPVITANGALIWDPAERKILWDEKMNNDEAIELLSFCKKNKLDFSALTMDCSYFSENSQRKERFDGYNKIAVQYGLCPMKLAPFDDSFACIKDKAIYKILVYEVQKGELELVQRKIDKFTETIYTSSEERLLDISHRNVSKGKGLLELCRLLNIEPKQVCAMGDYENDIPMLKQAGYSVAMGNGCSAIKKTAQFVTKSNEESGVAWAIHKYLKI